MSKHAGRPQVDQSAFEVPSGQLVIRNVGAAIAASAAEAAAEGIANAYTPANQGPEIIVLHTSAPRRRPREPTSE